MIFNDFDIIFSYSHQNAVPATIGIIDGRIKVGLNDQQFDVLAKTSEKTVSIKTSRRDLAYVISNGLNGGTTVAGTVIISNAVGINVFATGGIGGVHRDAHDSMDISADLTELGRSSIAVVSSGVKSILDIPKTLEYLVCNSLQFMLLTSINFFFVI